MEAETSCLPLKYQIEINGINALQDRGSLVTRHSLLPENYKDPATRAAILFALKPYENPGGGGANNPNVRWNLHKAWEEAENLLAHIRWRHVESLAFDPETAEYELSGYTDEDSKRINIAMAGIVAYQIMEPDSGVSIRRLEHKKGGEVNLVISHAVAEALKALAPSMVLASGAQDAGKEENPAPKSFLDYMPSVFQKLKIGRK